MTTGYQDLILDHSRHPRQHGILLPGARELTGINQLCGDEVALALRWSKAGGAEVSFTSRGCALCRASASILAEATSAKNQSEILALCRQFRQAYLGTDAPPVDLPKTVRALFDLRRYASRQRCVLLAWETLESLVEGMQ